MTALPGENGSDARARANAVLATVAAAIVLGIVLLVFFEPDVQRADAAELVERGDDARAFFVGDYVFILFYALVLPLAISRFGAALEGQSPWWLTAAVVLLPLAGVVDATENALLLAGADELSPDAVDVAHALAIPKIALFVAGAACALAVVARAVRARRA